MALLVMKCEILILVGNIVLSKGIEFDRRYTGVDFSPYVKNAEGGVPIPRLSSYTMADIKTMLEVISTKFSRVTISTVDAMKVPFAKNQTYYYDTYIRGRTPEAAAYINRERNQKALTVIVGILDNDDMISTATEVKVALESAEIANSIYPETVEGFLLSRASMTGLAAVTSTLYWLRTLKSMITTPDFIIGTLDECHDYISNDMNNFNITRDSEKVLKVKKDIIVESDFVICEFTPPEKDLKHGAKYSFDEIRMEIQRYRVKIRDINKNIEVFGRTYWPSGGNETWQTIDNLKDYWVETNEFASTNKYPVFLKSAFDNPREKLYGPGQPHMGWWKLSRNGLIRNVSGYIEKISGKRVTATVPPVLLDDFNLTKSSVSDFIEIEHIMESSKSHDRIVVGVLIGIIVVAMGIGYFCFIFTKRVSPEVGPLSKQDIRDFKRGLLDDFATQENYEGFVNALALKQPYDMCLEIPREALDILKDQALGGGQFGCVYKAMIRRNGKVQEAALKTTRQNCPGTALKGLLSEIKILTYLGKHENIVSICGAYTAEIEQGIIYLATELCPLGSLKNYLRKCRKRMGMNGRATWQKYANTTCIVDEVPIKDMVRWSHEIACGMEYLGQKNVIHADLATRNVLLSSDSTAKISDFGLSRRLYDYQIYTKQQSEPLPWRWMAIESLRRAEFSCQSDVWGFAVTLWEIFSLGDQPYPGIPWSPDFIESLENGLKLKQPQYATSEVYQIMNDCWQFEAEERPTFSELKHLLKIILSKTH